MRSPIRAWRNRFKIPQDIRALDVCGSCLAHLSGKRIQSPAIICKRLGGAALGYLSTKNFSQSCCTVRFAPLPEGKHRALDTY
jgi:hypothetical protein